MYDSVKRLEVLKELKTRRTLVIRMTLQETFNIVRINGKTSKDFIVTSGPLRSTVLFNAILEPVIRQSKITRGGKLL